LTLGSRYARLLAKRNLHNRDKGGEKIDLVEVTIDNYLRGASDKVTIRFDRDALVKLVGSCIYYRRSEGEETYDVIIPKAIESMNPDGTWRPYPSVTWLDGVECECQLVTRAIVKLLDGEGYVIATSPEGVPDGTLMLAAKKAGVYTETIDG